MASSNLQAAFAMMAVLTLLTVITVDISSFTVKVSCQGDARSIDPNIRKYFQSYSKYNVSETGYDIDPMTGSVIDTTQYSVAECQAGFNFGWIFVFLSLTITLLLGFFVFSHVIPGVGAS